VSISFCVCIVYTTTCKKQSKKLISYLKGHYTDPLDFGLERLVVAAVAAVAVVVVAAVTALVAVAAVAVGVAALAVLLTLDYFLTVYFVDGRVQLY